MSADVGVYQDADYTLALVIYETTAEATPKNLSGFTVVGYRIGQRSTDTTLLELTEVANANGSVVEFGTRIDGEVNITLTDLDLLDLPAARYAHQLILANGSGSKQVVLDGTLTVIETLPAA